MVPTLAPLVALFHLHTKLFQNAVEGLDEVDATARPGPDSNNVAFIAAHLVDARAWMGRWLGLDVPAPFDGLLEQAKSIGDAPVLPELARIRASWSEVTEPLAGRLGTIDEAELAAPSPRFPGVPETVLGGIAFLVHHEAYHIGQLAYLRKLVGSPPMSYR